MILVLLTGNICKGTKMEIRAIIDKIDENQLFIPSFQREFVWRREDAKSLIDSLIKDYPTGSILTWETSKPPHLRGKHKYSKEQGAVKLLLDGQQRVTTLYMLIKGEVPPYYTASEIIHDPRGLLVNVETLELSYNFSKQMENDPRWCDVTELFNRRTRTRDIENKLKKQKIAVNRNLYNKIEDNLNTIGQIVNRQYPEQTIPPKAKIRDAIDIFYKVNASGISLTDAELALAQISGYWPSARNEFQKKLTKLKQRGVILKLGHIMYILLGCMYYIGSDMKRLHGEENNERIREAWNILEKKDGILDYTFDFLSSHAFVDHTNEINSIYAVVPIIAYFFKNNLSPVSDDQQKRIVKWFYFSQIRQRYSGHFSQNLDVDLRIVKDSKRPFEELLSIIREDSRLAIIPDEFVGTRTSNPLFSLMNWYFKSRGAVCLITGLNIHQGMKEDYLIKNHTIFPSRQLRNYGYTKQNRLKYSLAQEITNRIFVNQVKTPTSAKEFLGGVEDQWPSEFEKQCLPSDESLWKLENYERFLKARRIQLAKNLNCFLENLTSSDDEFSEITIQELVVKGENEELEFKSSLRWDYHQGKKI